MCSLKIALLERGLFYALLVGALVLLTAGAGCATRSVNWIRTTTTYPDGIVTETNDVRYLNQGNDTAFGLMKFGRDEEGNPTLVIENYEATDQIARAAGEIAKAAAALARPLP